MKNFEKQTASKLVYDGKIIRLKVDTVELENGNSATRELVEHPGGVCVLATDQNGDILFVSQFRYPFGQVLLELPAGKLEPGEDPETCGRRELSEECGCTADVFEPLGLLYPTCAYLNEVIHIFYARGLTFTGQHLDPDEFLTVQRIPVQKAVEMVLSGEIADAKTQIGILKYKALCDAGKL